MTGFTVTPETFGPIASNLRATAQGLRAAWNPIKAQTAAVQFGRGDDSLSPLIQAALEAINEIVEDCVQSSVESLDSYADGLDDVAKLYTSTEDSTTSMLKPL